ncbi:stabilizer of axonemal microtubules 1 [Onthophagus taurus]|uniref:stabilizer of axonemal microtubules 1 n=1 Tax=Onthophagus taurus TaxID=166361 RepID=UPI000C20B936|nr:uncharacterized protein LOC111417177 [Onthophagus taurus]
MADCECSPPPPKSHQDGCIPCSVPVIPGGTPVTVVKPCQPPPAKNTDECCNVVVPIVTAVEDRPVPIKKKCRYIQPARPSSFKPDRDYKPPACRMDDGTTYNRSYLPSETERSSQFHPSNNLCVGEGRMSDNTTHNMSFQGHTNVLPPCPIVPCEHNFQGEGPMQDITTQKHDYVPKPFSKTGKFSPTNNIFSSDCPLSDKTTNRLSYMPVKGDRVAKFIPTNALELPTGRMSACTVNRMSFLPWEQQEKIDMPWAKKPKFVPPTMRMEGCTVQKMSFGPPGEYVECSEDCPDGIDCPELDCHTSVPKHKPQDCTAPCCCPRASC